MYIFDYSGMDLQFVILFLSRRNACLAVLSHVRPAISAVTGLYLPLVLPVTIGKHG